MAPALKILQHLLKPLIGVGIVVFLVFKGGLEPGLVLEAFRSHSGYIIAAFGIYTGLNLIAGYRWYYLARTGGLDVTLGRIFSLHMIGLFFVTLLPGGTGGDVVKGYYIYRDSPSKKGIALTSIVMDRFVGVYALLTFGMIGIILNYQTAFTHPQLRWNSWFYLSTFGTACVLIFLFFTPFGLKVLTHPAIEKLPGKKILRGLFDAFQVYRAYPARLFTAWLMTLLIHGGILLMFFFTALSLGIDLPFVRHAFVVPVLTMINGLPVSPGGIGVGEAAAEVLYNIMGCPSGSELLILFHVYVVAIAIAGAPFYLFSKKQAIGAQK